MEVITTKGLAVSPMAGQHAKPSDTNTKRAIGVVAGVTAGGLFGGIGLASVASAASVDDWDRIAAAESGDMWTPGSGQWQLPYGDADSTGGLQIQQRTWVEFGGLKYASAPYLATKKEQILIAEKILAAQGPSAWVVNAPGHGIASGALASSGPHASMYKGGINPYPSTSTTPATGGVVYVVVKGDTLSKIAAKELGSAAKWQVIYNLNKNTIKDPNKIFPGMKLVIRKAPVSYKVVAGDTLTSIAAKLKIPGGWKALYEANKATIGSNPNLIHPGLVLILPGGTSVPSTPAPTTPPTPTTSAYVRPVSGVITQVFHNPSSAYGLGWHTGVDFAGSYGETIHAVSAGTVVATGGAGAAYGNHVVVKHAPGVYTLYAHMASISVANGQTVKAGDKVGGMGNTGTNSMGVHLHLELRNDPMQYNASVFSDPVSWLRSHGVTI